MVDDLEEEDVNLTFPTFPSKYRVGLSWVIRSKRFSKFSKYRV